MSRLIRRVTKEPVSHVVVAAAGYVIHSNLLGVHAEPKQTFKSEFVYSIDLPPNYERLLGLFIKRRGSLYDFGALFYLGLRVLLPFLPKKNLWQSSGMYLCTEWAEEVIDVEADAMLTPYKLYLKLSESGFNTTKGETTWLV